MMDKPFVHIAYCIERSMKRGLEEVQSMTDLEEKLVKKDVQGLLSSKWPLFSLNKYIITSSNMCK